MKKSHGNHKKRLTPFMYRLLQQSEHMKRVMKQKVPTIRPISSMDRAEEF